MKKETLIRWIVAATAIVAIAVGNMASGDPEPMKAAGKPKPPAQVATPTFSPAGGTYTSAQNVAISCATSGATIRYTTNGSDPTASSTTYSSAIKVSSTTTIKAKAFKSGMTDSAVASATYTIKPPPVSHTARQPRPIQLGTSGGSVADLANGFCCSGTLGALVQDGAGTQYILSNTHVFAGDSVPGGNGIMSEVNDPIGQPGYVDVGCAEIPTDYVAALKDWIPIVPGGASTVDAAIAAVLPEKVDPAGRILEIGTLSSQPVAAFLGQLVKKSGRTSGVTQGKVAGLNATVRVQYTDECAGATYTSTFTGQVLVSPGNFLKAGDSGSLLVENVATNPRAVGLLYAGGSGVGVANPIQEVLNELGVELVGVPGSGGATANAAPLTAEVDKVSRAKGRNEARLMHVPGAVGHAVGFKAGSASKAAIKLLVEKITPAVEQAAPKEIDGIPVELWEVGSIIAY